MNVTPEETEVPSLNALVRNMCGKALAKMFGQELAKEHSVELEPEVSQVADAAFGHYQCNNALKLAKIVKKGPRIVAAEIVSALSTEETAFFEKIEIAGPGFINFTFSSQFLSAHLQRLMLDPYFGVQVSKSHREKIIVEFSSPNVAKELHVGHLRSTIIGDALARLFEFLGYEVLRLNHIGDWGTQFGMLIAYLHRFHQDVLTGKEKATLSDLMGWYRSSKKVFDEDPQFKKQAQKEVVHLQREEPDSLAAWEMICNISRQAFEEIYTLLDVKLTERGESFYNPYLSQVIKDLEGKGLITISDGAKCVFLEGFVGRDGSVQPMIVQKSDGGYNYDTTDMAAMWHRTQIEKVKRIIVVTDAGQSLHFQMVEQAAQKVGYLDPKEVEFNHVPFGVVLGSDGKKFKTRSGDTEKLIDLITEAITKAKEIFQTRLPDSSDEEIAELSQILGVDAIKYADLSSHRLKDYLFSYEKMLRFEGNTAAFLLYAFVRIRGIRRKVGAREGSRKEAFSDRELHLKQTAEIDLGLHLCRFAETLSVMARDLLPHRLCEYLYLLAEKFNLFFRDCRVEGSPEEESRLFLCDMVATVLEKGLHILGLKTLPRM